MKNQFINSFIFVLMLSCLILFIKSTSAQGIETSVPEMFRNQDDGSDLLRHQDDSLDTFGRQDDTNQSNNLDRRHDSKEINGASFNSTGKPCVTLTSYVTPELINKKIYEHWIKASNSCGQNIKVQVCYRKSADCIVMNVPPYDNKNAVLGIQPNMKDFQYDAKEK